MATTTVRLPRWRTRASTGQVTVTELFFDLVFVFVVTQATHEVEAHPGWAGLGHALLPLVVVWWMFLAFTWLTNAVRPDAAVTRMLLTLAMMAFFIIGLDLPYAFEPSGWAFPVAYLAVVAIHVALFLTASEPSARRGILRVVPFNAMAGLIVLLAPHLPGSWSWAAWVFVVLMLYLPSALSRVRRGFVLEAHHFVERHGLIILLVLGESIVAIGIGAGGDPVDGRLAAGVALGIALVTAVWWVYFDGDEERAVDALSNVAEDRRLPMAYNAFVFGHVTMVIGIILIAAGITDAIHHLDSSTDRWWLGCGTAVFLAGHAIHRFSLGTGRISDRLIGAVVAIPLGAVTAGAGWLALLALSLVLAVIGALDHRLNERGLDAAGGEPSAPDSGSVSTPTP
jgi:low temperature requirement protein LtrA